MKYKAILVGLILVVAATAATGQVDYEATSSVNSGDDVETYDQSDSSESEFMIPVHLEKTDDGTWLVKIHLSQELMDAISDTENEPDNNDDRNDEENRNDQREDNSDNDENESDNSDNDRNDQENDDEDQSNEDDQNENDEQENDNQENNNEADDGNEDEQNNEEDENDQNEEDNGRNQEVTYNGEYRYCYNYNGGHEELYDQWRNGQLSTVEFGFFTPEGEGTASLEYSEETCGERDTGNEDDSNNDDQENNDSNGDEEDNNENPSDGDEWSAEISEVDEVCMSEDQSEGVEDVTRSEDGDTNQVTWTGHIETPNPCYGASITDVTQTGEDSYRIDIDTEEEGSNCAQCIGMVTYNAEFSAEGSFELEIYHDGEQVDTIDSSDDSENDGSNEDDSDTGNEDDNNNEDDSSDDENNDSENENGVTEEAADIPAPEPGDQWFEAEGDGWISYVNPRDEYRRDYIPGADGPGSGKVCIVLLNEAGEPITGETVPNTEIRFPMGEFADWHPYANPITAEYPLTENYERPMDSDQFGTHPDLPQGDGYMDSHCIEIHQLDEDATMTYGEAEVVGEHADEIEILGYYDKINTWESDVDPVEIADPYGATSSSDGEIQFSPGNTHGEAYVIAQLDR